MQPRLTMIGGWSLRRRLCACADHAYKAGGSSNRDVTCCLSRLVTYLSLSLIENRRCLTNQQQCNVPSVPSLAEPGAPWTREAPSIQPWTTTISCRQRWRMTSTRRSSRCHHRVHRLNQPDVGAHLLAEFAVSLLLFLFVARTLKGKKVKVL